MRILFLLLLLALAVPSHALMIDEGANGPLPTQAITDRAMETKTNLEAVQRAFDNATARATVRTYPYDGKATVKVRLREYMHTMVVLPEGERIKDFTLGDSHIFALVPHVENDKPNNIFDLMGKNPGADTSLTVVGESGNIYSFYLRNDTVQSPFVPDLVVYITDDTVIKKVCVECQDKEKPAEQDKPIKPDYLASLPLVDPANINTNYVYGKGDESLAPLLVFDDGHFTYFKFGEENLDAVIELPVPYRVAGGYDTPVNSRIAKGTIIAETISGKWTLRLGDDYLCVRRDGE